MKTALITGGTSGIGLGIAKQYLADQMRVIVLGLGDLDACKDELHAISPQHEGRWSVHEANLIDPEARTNALSTVENVDVLVNCAGIQHVSAVQDFPAEKWEAIIALNLSAAFYASQAVLPHMLKQGWGRIINIASAHGLVASPYKSAYIAAKHGIIGLTKTLALEVAENGITVNAICPGYVRTPLVEGQIDDQMAVHGIPRESVIQDIMLAPQPTKRFVEIEEVAALAAFLTTSGAASITGAELKVDGGWTAR